MRVAVPLVENNGLNSYISRHFGHSRYFAVFDVENGNLENLKIYENPFEEHGPGQLPNFLKDLGVERIIVYGIGERALEFFQEFGIDVITGVEGKLNEIIDQFLKGELRGNLEWKGSEEFHHHD